MQYVLSGVCVLNNCTVYVEWCGVFNSGAVYVEWCGEYSAVAQYMLSGVVSIQQWRSIC